MELKPLPESHKKKFSSLKGCSPSKLPKAQQEIADVYVDGYGSIYL